MKSFSLLILSGLLFFRSFAQLGNLDLSFGGGDGYVTTDISNIEGATNVHVQQDGHILIAGYMTDSVSPTVVLQRYTPDGVLDNSYGMNGTVNTGMIAGGHVVHNWSVFQSDDKFVFLTLHDISSSETDVTIHRCQGSGFPDSTFGINGQVTTTLSPYTSIIPWGINIERDGKILVTGLVDYQSVSNPGGTLILRYNSDGTLDNTFDGDGIVMQPLTQILGTNILEQSNGKLIVCGITSSMGIPDMCGFARFNSDGSLDNSFGHNGVVLDSSFYEQNSQFKFAIDNNDNIIAAGEDRDSGVVRVSRYLSNGAHDLSFNLTGTLTVDFSTQDDFAWFTFALPDSRILILEGNGGILRLNTNGSFDNSFAIGGIDTVLKHLHLVGIVNTLQSDGKIVVAGISSGTGEADFMVARLFPGNATDINETSPILELANVYPNPTKEELCISVSNFLPTLISIFNLNGSKIYEQKFQPRLDVSSLATGIYFVEIKGAETVRKKFIKL